MPASLPACLAAHPCTVHRAPQGASRGLGLEMARLLLRRVTGTVVATCRAPSAESAAGLRALLMEEQQAAGGAGRPCRLRVVALDLEGGEAAVSRAAAEISAAAAGRVDVLLNVAGILHDSAT
jgi:NAD(P)-dependent dehydrogenase (short-subunit alcohol dehydrogenase family)